MTRRDNNPDRLDDGARAEAEMKERGAGCDIADAVLSWMVKYDLLDAGNEYHASDVLAILNDLVPSAALPAPQGDDGLAERLRNYGLSHMKGMPAIINEAVSALRSQAAEIAGLKAEYHRRGVKIIEMTEFAGAHLCRAEAAESRLASAMEALEPFVAAFERRRDAYSRRHSDRKLGYANFDKMPDRWKMEPIGFTMSVFRRARTTLSSIKGEAE